MREMTGPVSWLEAGWQSLPSAEAPVGGTRANLFRRSKTATIVEASDSGGAAPDFHQLPLLQWPAHLASVVARSLSSSPITAQVGLARAVPPVDTAVMTEHDTLDLTLLLGGVRAGKSARAVEIARASTERSVLFVATAQALDDEMRQRIATHKAERPAEWATLESPIDLARDIDRALTTNDREARIIIVDCLTLWVSNVMLSLDETVDAESRLSALTTELVTTMRHHARGAGKAARRWIVVSNEVGLGIVPSTPLGRRYRDVLGRVNRIVAAASSETTLMVAGLEMPLRSREHVARAPKSE
jgi:adenosyl cobinamide kinase/adenosyl cobinamide phosphate guanylyltransferase